MGCTVTIPTRNRQFELERTLRVLHGLCPPPDEILVGLDGCEDGSLQMVRTQFPQCRLIIHDKPKGSIATHDELTRLASFPYVLNLDDDSHPIEPDFIAHLIRTFEKHPDIAVLSFPQRTEEFPESLEQEDFGPPRYVGTYVNAAAAFNKTHYLRLGGLPPFFEHMGDESDLALRATAAGLQIYHDTTRTIRHYWSAKERNEIRNHHRHARNEQWSILMHCPFPWWPLLCLRRALGQCGYAATRGWRWILQEPHWWSMTLQDIHLPLRRRRPLPWPAYRHWLALRKDPRPTEPLQT